VGSPQTRFSPEWRPFSAGLSPRSTAYALSVIGAMFRWLIEQRYVLANPEVDPLIKTDLAVV
jgi:site-specific recombinase XerC